MVTELEFIQSQDEWPQWPVLPVVERKGMRSGLVIPGPPNVYLVNLFDLSTGFLREVLKDVKKVEYETFEDLLEDWRID
jgi:hypothetical protein